MTADPHGRLLRRRLGGWRVHRPNRSSGALSAVAALALFAAVLVACTPDPGVGGAPSCLTLPSAAPASAISPAPNSAPPEVPAEGTVDVLLTTGDRTHLLSDEPDLSLAEYVPGQPVSIDVDPEVTYQTMEGVGAALSDSAACLMHIRLTDSARSDLISELFGPAGANLNYVRLPLSSSDFSTDDYTYNDMPFPQKDPGLTRFSIARDEAYTIPILQQIRAVNPEMRLMGSAWSAPGWMKTDNLGFVRKGLIGGTLAPEHIDDYAQYLRRVAEEYRSRGLPFDAMTLQNEPAHSPFDYAGMLLPPGREAALAAATGEEFNAAGLDTDLLTHDHNWDLSSRAITALSDPVAAEHIDGTAWHCYGGNPSAQSAVHNAFPTKDIYFTECSGTFSLGDFSGNLLWNTNNLLIGSTRNWAKSVLLWNLALDERGGPRVGGCSNCRGVVTINSATGEVTRNEEYFALAQFARGVRPGAVRIDSTESAGPVRSVAFRNPDGSKALLLTNDSDANQTVAIRDGSRTFSYTMPPRSVATFMWT